MDTQTQHTLRLATVLGFPPAAAFLVAHLIVVRRVVPVIGIIPMAASALLGIAYICQAHRDRPLTTSATVCFDSGIAIVLFSILIPSVIDSLRGWDPGHGVLATYGICFMWVDFFIHLYLIYLACRSWSWTHCPHCNCAAHERVSQIKTVYPYYADHKPAYERRPGPQADDEDDGIPRPSMCTSILTVGDLASPSSDNLSSAASTGSKTLF